MSNGAMQNGYLNGASGNGHAAPESASLDLRVLWDTFLSGWWIILLVAGATTFGAYYYTKQLTPIYRASSIVKLNTSQMVTPEQQFFFLDDRSVEIELGVLQYSEEIPMAVARRMVQMAEAMGTTEHYTVLQGIGEGDDMDLRRAARRINRMVYCVPADFTNMIRILAESSVPEEAALLATVFAEEYQAYTKRKSRESLIAARAYLEEQVERRQEDLFGEEQRWESFARSREVVTYGAGGEMLVNEYTALGARLDETLLRLDTERGALQLLQDELERIEPSLRGQVRQDIETAEINAELDQLNRTIAELEIQRDNYYVNSPELRGRESEDRELSRIMRNLAFREQQRDALREQLIDEASAEGSSLGEAGYASELRARIKEKEIEISGLQTLRSTLQERLASYSDRLDQLPRQAIEQEQLQRRIAMAEQWYSMFAQRLQQIIISEESELGYIDIVQEASTPGIPVRPNTNQNIMLGLLLGLGLGLGLAFLRVMMDTRIESPEDVKKRGHNLLGIVPTMGREIRANFKGKEMVEVDGQPRSTKLLTLHSPWSPTSENFRLIRTNLFQTNADRALQTFLVTSPEPGDGKSVTTLNLAISLAQSGRRTLVIDADMRRPTVHKMMGVDNENGLAELLLEKQSFTPETFETSIPRLSFIPSGKIDVPPGELLGHTRMATLLDAFRQHYDTVIIDTPPVLAVTDALTLAKYCDGGVLVVSANKTNGRAYSAAEEALRKAGMPILGVVLNRLSAGGKSGRYKYGYGYGYGYYKEYATA